MRPASFPLGSALFLALTVLVAAPACGTKTVATEDTALDDVQDTSGLTDVLADAPDTGSPTDAVTPPADATVVTYWHFQDLAGGNGVGWVSRTPNREGGANLYDHGAGMAAGDFNGDGHEDLLLLSQCGPTGYFLGKGDGTFTDASSRVTMLNDGIRVAVAYGDYDEDGDTDFAVTFTRRPMALLRQNADGSFTDVAAQAGIALNGHYSGTSFADVNHDGYLDLIVAGNKRHTTQELISNVQDCEPFYAAIPAVDVYGAIGSDASALFLNGGPSKQYAFTNVGAAFGVPQGGDGAANLGFGDLQVADVNMDGWVDVLLPEMFGATKALRNDGTGHFTDVTATWLPRFSFGPPGVSVADFNNDGWPDLYFTDMHADMGGTPGAPYASVDPSQRWLGFPNEAYGDNPAGPYYGNTLFMGVDGTKFTESDLAWHAETYQPWGNLVADLDNDGFEDVFIAAGMSNPFDYIPNALLHNDGTKFTRVEKDVGLDPPPAGAFDPDIRVLGQPLVASSRTAAVADFDEDGALDLVVSNWQNRVNIYHNLLPKGAHWLDVRVAGKAPHDPYGVPVRVKAGGKTFMRSLRGSTGYLSQSTRWVHFGLGTLSAVDEVSVTWPDGKVTTVKNPPIDGRVTVAQ